MLHNGVMASVYVILMLHKGVMVVCDIDVT